MKIYGWGYYEDYQLGPGSITIMDYEPVEFDDKGKLCTYCLYDGDWYKDFDTAALAAYDIWDNIETEAAQKKEFFLNLREENLK